VIDGPYAGLMPFSEEQAPYFFGRDAEREVVTANLMAATLTLFYGPSGVGKSSVINAGVAYHLRREAREALAAGRQPQFAIVLFREWRDEPLGALEREITREVGAPGVGATFGDRLQSWAAHLDGELLIVFDQFEEYFLYHPGDTGETSFASEFARAVNRRDLRASFLISMREDSIAKLDFFKGRIPNLFDNYLRIGRLDRGKGREAIVLPIEQFNRLGGASEGPFSIEPALVEAVLDQVRASGVTSDGAGLGAVRLGEDETIETPHLQLVMTRLWQEERAARSTTLRLATLDRLGGASAIVSRHVESALDALSPAEREAAARIFQYLVTPAGTKIALGVEDLQANSGLSAEALRALLLRLSAGDSRILVSVAPAPDQPNRERFQIFHDVLAQKVLDWRRRYVAAAEQRAAEAVAEEQRRRAEKEAMAAARLRRLLAVAALLAVTATGLAALAWQQMQEARAQRQTADRLRIVADKGAADADLANRSAEQRRLELLAASAARGALEQENRNLQLARNAAEARLAGRATQAARLEQEAVVAAQLAATRRADEARLLDAARREQQAGDVALQRSEAAQRQLDSISPAVTAAEPTPPPEPTAGPKPAPETAPSPPPDPTPLPAPPETETKRDDPTGPGPPLGTASPPPEATPRPTGDYREVYRRGINAKNRKQWKDAATLFEQALQLRSTDTGERISITGFGNIEPYVPHYYLGLALMNLNDCAGALRNWERAEQDGAIQKTNLYRDLEGGRRKCAPK
jgi:hypothetical protein